MSNVKVSVHILRNHFRGGWRGQVNDCFDYAGRGVQNWAKVDYVICARSLIHVTVHGSTLKNCVDLSSIEVKIK